MVFIGNALKNHIPSHKSTDNNNSQNVPASSVCSTTSTNNNSMVNRHDEHDKQCSSTKSDPISCSGDEGSYKNSEIVNNCDSGRVHNDIKQLRLEDQQEEGACVQVTLTEEHEQEPLFERKLSCENEQNGSVSHRENSPLFHSLPSQDTPDTSNKNDIAKASASSNDGSQQQTKQTPEAETGQTKVRDLFYQFINFNEKKDEPSPFMAHPPLDGVINMQ